jgi:hypothetical protein
MRAGFMGQVSGEMELAELLTRAADRDTMFSFSAGDEAITTFKIEGTKLECL